MPRIRGGKCCFFSHTYRGVVLDRRPPGNLPNALLPPSNDSLLPPAFARATVAWPSAAEPSPSFLCLERGWLTLARTNEAAHRQDFHLSVLNIRGRE